MNIEIKIQNRYYRKIDDFFIHEEVENVFLLVFKLMRYSRARRKEK